MLKKFIPKPIRSKLGKVYDFTRFRSEYLSLKRRLRQDYPGINLEIAPADEMYLYQVQKIVSDPYQAKTGYLQIGESMLKDIESIFHDIGYYSFDRVNSFLDFASGYGRFTRFLVHRVPASKVTVSDIDPKAVDSNRRAFGVKGFYSQSDPADVTQPDKFDVIFVASLFSHLSPPHWGAWLTKLYEMLNPGGLLIFSTHGLGLLETLNEATKLTVKELAPGFLYRPANETLGRLDEGYYGTAYVTEGYVREFVESHLSGELLKFYPKRLGGFQDIYVIEQSDLMPPVEPS